MDIIDPDFEEEVNSMELDITSRAANPDIYSSDEESQSELVIDEAPPSRRRRRSGAEQVENFERLTGSRPNSLRCPATGKIVPSYLMGSQRGPYGRNSIKVRLQPKTLIECAKSFEAAEQRVNEVSFGNYQS